MAVPKLSTLVSGWSRATLQLAGPQSISSAQPRGALCTRLALALPLCQAWLSPRWTTQFSMLLIRKTLQVSCALEAGYLAGHAEMSLGYWEGLACPHANKPFALHVGTVSVGKARPDGKGSLLKVLVVPMFDPGYIKYNSVLCVAQALLHLLGLSQAIYTFAAIKRRSAALILNNLLNMCDCTATTAAGALTLAHGHATTKLEKIIKILQVYSSMLHCICNMSNNDAALELKAEHKH